LWGRGEEETRRAPGEPLSRSQPQLRVLALVKHKKMRAVTRHGEAAQRAHPALNWPDCATPPQTLRMQSKRPRDKRWLCAG